MYNEDNAIPQSKIINPGVRKKCLGGPLNYEVFFYNTNVN